MWKSVSLCKCPKMQLCLGGANHLILCVESDIYLCFDKTTDKQNAIESPLKSVKPKVLLCFGLELQNGFC